MSSCYILVDGQMHTVTIPTPSYTEKTAAKVGSSRNALFAPPERIHTYGNTLASFLSSFLFLFSVVLAGKSAGGAVLTVICICCILQGSLLSPMPGKIVKILVKSGDHVKKGQSLVIMEAMKMEVGNW